MDPQPQIDLDTSWQPWLLPQLQQPYMQHLLQVLDRERAEGRQIFPAQEQLFAAFNCTPFDRVRVVILGQDPYHGPGQAHGLSFSVLPGCALPPSLRNIYKEMNSDVGVAAANAEFRLGSPVANGCLLPWATQGVLLLNAVMSVEAGRPGSHQDRGWEQFTDCAIESLSRHREHLVFLLWGAYAQRKGRLIDRERHLVLESAHPSPLSASRGFFGCRHFSQTNDYLRRHGHAPIDWTGHLGANREDH